MYKLNKLVSYFGDTKIDELLYKFWFFNWKIYSLKPKASKEKG